jgi:hypothetical protein
MHWTLMVCLLLLLWFAEGFLVLDWCLCVFLHVYWFCDFLRLKMIGCSECLLVFWLSGAGNVFIGCLCLWGWKWMAVLNVYWFSVPLGLNMNGFSQCLLVLYASGTQDDYGDKKACFVCHRQHSSTCLISTDNYYIPAMTAYKQNPFTKWGQTSRCTQTNDVFGLLHVTIAFRILAEMLAISTYPTVQNTIDLGPQSLHSGKEMCWSPRGLENCSWAKKTNDSLIKSYEQR